MRKTMFRLGWTIIFFLPVAFTIEVFREQNIPDIQPWKWAILIAAVLLVILGRNRDEVLNHHVIARS